MIGQNVPACQIQIFVRIGRVGHCQQFHPGLLGGSSAFVIIAPLAGGYDIGPGVLAASGRWDNMVTGQVIVTERFAAVQAQVPIAPEQGRIVERWGSPLGACAMLYAMNGNDGMDIHVRKQPIQAVTATMQNSEWFTDGPGHHALGVITGRFFVVNPMQRITSAVQSKYGCHVSPP